MTQRPAFKTSNDQAEDTSTLKALTSQNFAIKAGPVGLDTKCLSCSGVPSHTMELFKMACISYQPSQVNYRNNLMNRKNLLEMRKTLIDKCEELINSDQWPHGK